MHTVRPSGHIDHCLGQRLIKGYQRISESSDALLVAHCGTKCLTEHDGGVLDSVVGVNVPVAGAFHIEVYQGMPSEGREHVIEEPNPGRDLGTTCPIQVETYPDFRLR